MATLSAEQKIYLKDKIIEVSNNFTGKSFFSLVEEFKIIMSIVPFTEIENWLFQLIRQENIAIVNGLLADLYYGSANYEDARQYAALARDYFAKLPLWDEIIKRSNDQLNNDDTIEECEF